MSEDFIPRPEHRGVSHYYGDTVRVLFVIAAALLFISQFIPGPFVTPIATLICAVIYIVAAGLTNPVQAWIHWLNVLVAGVSLIFFGAIAIARYQALHAFSGNTLIVFALVIIFVIGLYSSIRTLRGALMRGAPTIE